MAGFYKHGTFGLLARLKFLDYLGDYQLLNKVGANMPNTTTKAYNVRALSHTSIP
jgi:hypothetical protein